jgi:hypothetical protein
MWFEPCLNESMRSLTIGVLALLGLAGCSAGAGDDLAAADSAVSAAAPQLGRHYAGMLRSTIDVRSEGKVQTLVTTVRAFAEFDTSGGDDQVRLKLKACSFNLPSIDGFKVAIDDSVLQRSVPEVTMAARITSAGGRASFTTQPTVLLLGLQSVSASDPLPTDEDDSRVIDQDKDRKAGFTLKGTKGGLNADIYAGVRAVASGEGEIGPDGSIVARGELRYDFKKDVSFFGDSVPIFDAAGLARDTLAKAEPIPGTEKQEFRLVKLADDGFASSAAKCAAVARSL